MRRVPLLSGSRVVLVPAGDDDVLLLPPPPPEQVVDATAAVRDALRFPLAGPSLEELVRPNGRATIVVEPRALPVPGAQTDPRPAALAAASDELARSGISDERQTIFVAGGLGQRVGHRELERILPPPVARAFRGSVVVHDAEDPDLVTLADSSGSPIRIHPAITDTDLVLVVGAAETVLHGGPGTLLAACDAGTVRRAAAIDSLVEAAGAPEWELALEIEGGLARRVPVLGVSLVLDLPRLTGPFRDYPSDVPSLERVARSQLRRVFSLLPAGIRREVLKRQARRLTATAAFAGPPSVAHAEALLRGVDLRSTSLAAPVDALVVGVPWTGPHVPREPVNPVTSAALTLGLALRLHRDAFAVEPGGTVILLHSFRRAFTPPQAPYRQMLHALRDARDGDLARAELEAKFDDAALEGYRAGRTCHPLLPFADWAGCGPALSRLGRVIVAGSRDANAARMLGFVPTRSVGSALEMAHGVAGGRARVGVMPAPPYAPVIVGAKTEPG